MYNGTGSLWGTTTGNRASNAAICRRQLSTVGISAIQPVVQTAQPALAGPPHNPQEHNSDCTVSSGLHRLSVSAACDC